MRPLMAQPLASSSGPRLRSRNLSQAISMLGPEMASISPTTASGISGPSSSTLESTATSTVLSDPRATPMAATVPTSVLRGTASAGLALPSARRVAWACSPWVTAASLVAARLATCSSTMRKNFLYGEKNAWPTLVGLSIRVVMRASQSWPLRS